MAEHFQVTNPGFLELLAINVINLHRILMISRDESIPLIKRLRQELMSPQPGDIILELSSTEQPYKERIGFLDAIVAKDSGDLYLIQKLDGDYETVQGKHFVKVPNEVIYS